MGGHINRQVISAEADTNQITRLAQSHWEPIFHKRYVVTVKCRVERPTNDLLLVVVSNCQALPIYLDSIK